jgi:Saxitoxin biosynthesis operon protein SxtJ
MQNEIASKQLRSFGLTVGGIFALIGFWPLVIRSADPRWWALLIGVCLAVPAVVYPACLYWIYKGWMILGHVLGWINTRVILGAVFYLVVTPTGIIRSWLGKDSMGRQLKPELDSYRIIRQPRPPSHLNRQY